MMMTEEVLFAQEGQLGLITLNRPSALNALNLPMIKKLQQQLQLWKEDDKIKAVVIRAVEGNAFCAGGDVRWLYQSGLDKNPEQMQFFWHEYRLNYFISQFGKPFIALMNGITMGGGVGISLHGSHPVATERFVFAMPETSIGFFPDIGASHLLSHCPGAWGIYLGLTGNRIGPQEALSCGLIKTVVASEDLGSLVEKLFAVDLSIEAHERVNECIRAFAMKPTLNEDNQLQAFIDSCFSLSSVELIQEALSSCNHPWTEGLMKTLEHKCPLSLKVTLIQLQKAKGLSLAECLKMDFDLVTHFMQGSDFYEGIRALLVDKDKNPKWNPLSLDLVTEGMVVNYFEQVRPVLEFDF